MVKPAARAPQRPPQRQQPTRQQPTRPPAQTQSQRSTEISLREDQVPDYLVENLAQNAGAGLSSAAEDNLVPMIYVLQAQSPQAMRGHDKEIDGAQAGSIWLRNAPEEIQIQDGEDGVVFQHCSFGKDWVEWMPNRGGFVARHAERPVAAELMDEVDENNRPRKVWRMPNGNAVVETRYHNGNVYVDGLGALPYSIPLSSTGHSVSKAWMLSMNRRQHNGVTLPGPACLWRLRTKLQTKNNNSWYMLDVSFENYASPEQYALGMKLLRAFESGEKRVQEPEEMSSEENGGGVQSEHI